MRLNRFYRISFLGDQLMGAAIPRWQFAGDAKEVFLYPNSTETPLHSRWGTECMHQRWKEREMIATNIILFIQNWNCAKFRHPQNQLLCNNSLTFPPFARHILTSLETLDKFGYGRCGFVCYILLKRRNGAPTRRENIYYMMAAYHMSHSFSSIFLPE